MSLPSSQDWVQCACGPWVQGDEDVFTELCKLETPLWNCCNGCACTCILNYLCSRFFCEADSSEWESSDSDKSLEEIVVSKEKIQQKNDEINNSYHLMIILY